MKTNSTSRHVASALLTSVIILLQLAASRSFAQSNWVEDFSNFNRDNYHLGGMAYCDQNEHYFVLTNLQGGQTGRIFNLQHFSMAIFSADFDVFMGGGGDGSDGMTFAWITAYDYQQTGGGALDLLGTHGFAIEFDTYQNGEYNDPSAEYIGLIRDDVTHHLAAWNCNVNTLDCNQWRHVRVTNYLGHIQVFWDGNQVIDYQIENYQPFDGYFGFTAATGGGVDWHNVDNVVIAIGGAEMEVAGDRIEFGPVATGNSRDQSLRIYNRSQDQDEWHVLNLTVSDVGQDPDWLTLDPDSAGVDAGDSVDVTFTASTEGLDVGEYARTIRIESNDPDHQLVEIPAHLFVVEGFSRFYGTVTDAANNNPVEGAVVAVPHFGFADTTDGDGNYEFPQMPSFAYTVTVVAQDYLPITVDTLIVEANNDLERNFSLLHSVCLPHPDQVNVSLPSNDNLESVLTIANPGNGPLTWTAEKVFPQEHVAEPWALRQAINIGAGLHDDRIEGVAFDGEHFYFAGANGANPSTIYVTDRDGNETNHYTQLGASQYGMKDLEWDGDLLWGAGYLQNVYGFTPEGDSVISFQTAYNPTGNIAYDSDEDLLWVSGTTSNISAYDRQGHAANRTLNRKGLKVYGLSYWPEDPDGYNLYIFDQPAVGLQMVHKMNTHTNDTLLVISIPTNNGEAPSGIFISNLWDPYSWVMLSMQNISPNNGSDRLAIWQLGQRTDWVLVSSNQGVIPAGESTDLTITFNSAGMPVDQHFDATLHITHDGVGSVTDVPIVMNVTGAGGMSQRNVGLAFGWNLISVNVTPQGAEDFTAVVQPLVDAGLLIMAKDGAGNFYRPQNQFNNINGWSPAQSYWLKMGGDAQLSITGEVLAADTPIDLTAGWNNVSYLPRQPVEAPTALSGLADNLTIARDGFGRFYLPAYHFSDLGQMVEGAGYQLRVREAAQLVYSLGGREASFPSRYSAAEVNWLNEIHPTASMHNLLVEAEGFAAGTRLEALTPSGLVAGRGVVGSDGLAGLTLWGDDPATEVVEGFKEGEEPALRCTGEVKLRPYGDVTSETLVLRDGDLAFTDGGWGVVEIGNATVPSNFSLTAAYPNPFNSRTIIHFALPVASRIRLTVYDAAGRRITTLYDGQASAGTHAVNWSAGNLGSGLYIVNLTAGGQRSSKKVMLIK